MENTEIREFRVNYDKYGKLVALEENDNIPFEIKRVYYIYEVDENVRRGFHSHKHLQQVLICVHGSVKILLKTPQEEKIITLDDPKQGLYIGPNIWREMYDFTDGAVLLVLASEHYDVNDYIRDYMEYERHYKKGDN